MDNFQIPMLEKKLTKRSYREINQGSALYYPTVFDLSKESLHKLLPPKKIMHMLKVRKNSVPQKIAFPFPHPFKK